MSDYNYTYYGTAESEAAAKSVINFKVITDDWRVLVPPTPLFVYHQVEYGTIFEHVGVWFMLHRFHTDPSE